MIPGTELNTGKSKDLCILKNFWKHHIFMPRLIFPHVEIIESCYHLICTSMLCVSLSFFLSQNSLTGSIFTRTNCTFVSELLTHFNFFVLSITILEKLFVNSENWEFECVLFFGEKFIQRSVCPYTQLEKKNLEKFELYKNSFVH